MLRQWHDTGRCDRWHQLRQRWLQACHQFIHGVVADSDKFNRLVSPSLARNPYLESSFNNCSGPLHLLFCSSPWSSNITLQFVMRESDSGMQWQCYSWRGRPDTRFQACQLILQMWSFVDSMPRLVLLQYSDSLPTNMSRNLDGDLQYFPCHRHDKAYLKTPFMECHSEKQIEGRDTRPCHTGDFDGPSRWCISVAHYDSQYIAEWYLKKLGM